jgi:hypothetical protein
MTTTRFAEFEDRHEVCKSSPDRPSLFAQHAVIRVRRVQVSDLDPTPGLVGGKLLVRHVAKDSHHLMLGQPMEPWS